MTRLALCFPTPTHAGEWKGGEQWFDTRSAHHNSTIFNHQGNHMQTDCGKVLQIQSQLTKAQHAGTALLKTQHVIHSLIDMRGHE